MTTSVNDATAAAALVGPELREEVDRLCRSQWGWGAPREVRIDVLKPHQRRCVMEISIQAENRRQKLIGKAYQRDRSDVYLAMNAIRDAGFGPEAEFSIPQPLAHLAALGVRLEEKVSGLSARDILLKGDGPEGVAAARRCAAWLARFQATAPPLGAPTPGTEPERWRGWIAELAARGEPLAGKARMLLQRLNAAMPRSGTEGYRAAHGSYIPNHVILNERRTVAIDLDRYGIADPAREAAGFGVSLQRLALKELGSFQALEGPAEAFLSAYIAATGRVGLPHYGFYRAVECLLRARRDVHGRTPPAIGWAEMMLDEGVRALNEEE